MKLTAVGCDNCGRSKSFQNWSRLWRDAQREGWVRGASNDEHFCCEVCREQALSAVVAGRHEGKKTKKEAI